MTHDEVPANTLATLPLFAGLDASALEPLTAAVRRVELAEGEKLFNQGDRGDTLYIVVSGRLKVYTHDSNQQEVVLDIVGPDQVLGELAFIDGKARSATVEAITGCVVFALDREPFMEHLRQHPETSIHLLQYLSQNLRQRVLQAEVTPVSDSAARLAHTILFLADRNGKIEPGLVTSTLRKKDLAAAIGTSEEWVSQMLNEWCREGIIGLTGTRRLLLHDVEALKVLSQRDD